MLNYSNPYDVLSETISFENVQLMSEMITLKTLRGRYAYARQGLALCWSCKRLEP